MQSFCARLVAVIFFCALCDTGFADKYPRNKQIDILHYVFRLTVQQATDEISGHATVTVRFREAGVEHVTLDLTGKTSDSADFGMVVDSVHVDGQSTNYEHRENRLQIEIDRAVAVGQETQFDIRYRGTPRVGLIIRNNMHGDRTFFADNFPNYARGWLPVLDHPYDKATCEFVVSAPAQYQVVSNGILVEETDLPGGLRDTHWRQDIPIPTYLMVIGVARFAVQHVKPVNHIPIQSWVFPQDKVAGFALFGRAGEPLKFFIERIGPYPYQKLGNVQSTNRFGATEFASSVFYGESIIARGDGFGVMVHEVAHQWFGDSITTHDWNHVWLSEGFATYLTALYFEAKEGREQLIQTMQRARQRVIRSAAQKPDQPLIDYRLPVNQTLTSDAYQKGAWVLHMLRRNIGDDHFWNGLRAYYRQFRDQNASSEDFQKVMESVSGKDLSQFFGQWLFAPGYPQLSGDWYYDNQLKQLAVRIEQVQKPARFQVPLELGIRFEGVPDVEIRTVQITDKSHEFKFSVDAIPTEVQLDPDTWLLMEADFAKRDEYR